MNVHLGGELIVSAVIAALWAVTLVLAKGWANNVTDELKAIRQQLGAQGERVAAVEARSRSNEEDVSVIQNDIRRVHARVDTLSLAKHEGR